MDLTGAVGVFDSGVGGISVLKELVRELPQEHFYYFGDSANAPYGEKSVAEVQRLSLAIADHMAAAGCKAMVVACNTATSAAVQLLRERYGFGAAGMPIIGIEPALKPASEALPHGRILVMATPVTLHLDKYHRLSGRLAGRAEFIPVICAGLADRVEQGDLDAPDMLALLHSLLDPYAGRVDGVVLGCTHYPFLKRQIRAVLGNVPLFDGGAGTARELRRQLVSRHLLRRADAACAAPAPQDERGGTGDTTARCATPATTDPAPQGKGGVTADAAAQCTGTSARPATGRVTWASSVRTEAELRLYQHMFALPL